MCSVHAKGINSDCEVHVFSEPGKPDNLKVTESVEEVGDRDRISLNVSWGVSVRIVIF